MKKRVSLATIAQSRRRLNEVKCFIIIQIRWSICVKHHYTKCIMHCQRNFPRQNFTSCESPHFFLLLCMSSQELGYVHLNDTHISNALRTGHRKVQSEKKHCLEISFVLAFSMVLYVYWKVFALFSVLRILNIC